MNNYGLKVSIPGVDVKTATIDELNFTSKYNVFKISSTGSGSFTTGNSATIAHGLGYPATFLVYTSTDNTNFHLYGNGTRSYIDSTNLVITKDRPTTITYFYHGEANDCSDELGGTYFPGTGAIVGRSSSSDFNGALRFPGVTETSCTKAEIGFKIASNRNGTVQVITKGIDEDNTSDFAGSPFGRPRTDATITNSCDNGITAIWVYEVTSIFNEIVGRSGWSSGNAMGFVLLNNGNSNSVNVASEVSTNGSYLKISKLAAEETIYYKYVIFTHKLDSTKAL